MEDEISKMQEQDERMEMLEKRVGELTTSLREAKGEYSVFLSGE